MLTQVEGNFQLSQLGPCLGNLLSCCNHARQHLRCLHCSVELQHAEQSSTALSLCVMRHPRKLNVMQSANFYAPNAARVVLSVSNKSVTLTMSPSATNATASLLIKTQLHVVTAPMCNKSGFSASAIMSAVIVASKHWLPVPEACSSGSLLSDNLTACCLWQRAS